jgi:hypothetical protein
MGIWQISPLEPMFACVIHYNNNINGKTLLPFPFFSFTV